MMRMSSIPARTASSTTYWIAGLSTIGSISLGCALVAGRNRVPRPAAGMTAFVTLIVATVLPGSHPRRPRVGLALVAVECQCGRIEARDAYLRVPVQGLR